MSYWVKPVRCWYSEQSKRWSSRVSSVLCVAGNEEIAQFLLQNGAGFSSYTLMDHPAFSKHLLRLKLQETSTAQGEEVCVLEMCFWNKKCGGVPLLGCIFNIVSSSCLAIDHNNELWPGSAGIDLIDGYLNSIFIKMQAHVGSRKQGRVKIKNKNKKTQGVYI